SSPPSSYPPIALPSFPTRRSSDLGCPGHARDASSPGHFAPATSILPRPPAFCPSHHDSGPVALTGCPPPSRPPLSPSATAAPARSEERRVGKECRSRCAPQRSYTL